MTYLETRIAALALALAAWALPAHALQEPHTEVLPNGLRLVLLETRSNPTVSLNVFVRVGSVDETPELNGMSHFYEHMFFRGTPNLSGFEFKRAIESIGGTTNASTTRDFTHYYINLPAEHVGPGLQLLADALMNAEVTPEAVDQERNAVKEEYRIGSESPYRMVHDRLFGLAFAEHPYGRPIIGTMENIERFRREDFLRFRDRFYVPERTSIVIVGDVDRQAVLRAARELFGRFRRPGPAPLEPALGAWPDTEQVVIEEAPVTASFVVLGFRGPSVKDRPDIYRVDVLSFLLGIGRGSMLGKALVDTDLAYEARVDFLTQQYPGLILVVATGEPGKEQEIKQKLLETLERVKLGDFTDRELERARQLLRSTYVYGNETNAGKADSLGFYATIDEVEFATSYLDRVAAVDREGIIEAARKYLGDGFYSVLMKPRSEPPAARRSRL